MKGKIYLILALVSLMSSNIYSETTSENEVEIDLNSNKMVSKDGVNVKYGALKLKAFEMQVDQEKNKAYVPGEFYIEADEPTGQLKMDLRDGEVSLDGKQGRFGKSLGYLEVGAVTGAEKPNDKIYFGGESTDYKDGKVYLNNAWFTTDPKIRTTRDPLKTGYHLKSDKIIVEPDKQVTFLNSDLYIGEKDIIPFTLPWYRFNIRQGSKVPLFPQWGTRDEYGWFITTGMLYGDKDSKFKGGIAPKFGDQIGLMIGRMENWYDLGKYGKGQLNIDDWLVYKKAEKNDVERNFDRWDFNYNHRYSGEYGYLNADYRNATYNMIPTMDDAIDKYFRGKAKQTPSNGWKYVDGVPDKGGNLGFYKLDTDLKNLGENKDITLKAKVNLVSDKEKYGVIVADQLDDMDYNAMADYDLTSEVALNQDNDRYSVGGYYRYLYDMDPGSTKNDMQSRAEDFGFHINDKKYKINLSYDDKTGDKYRKLNSWERDPNFSKVDNKGAYGIKFDYTPWTVSQYTKYDSQNAKATFGEYELYGDWKIKAGYEYNHFEHELSLQDDPFRDTALLKGTLGKTNNLRDVEYNRYENIIYNKTTENRAFVDFIYGNTKFTLAGGDTKEEIWDREGIYDKEGWSDGSYKIYINESTFYEGGVSQDKIPLGALGNLSLYGNIRVDQYDKGYANNTEVSTDDKSTRYRAGLTHDVTIFDNTVDKNRTLDLTLTNTLNYMYQDYSYSGGDNNINKDIRLRHKENIQNVTDTVEFDLGNTKTIYTVDYKDIKRASTNGKKGEILNQKLDFLIDDENSIGLEYALDKRYTDQNERNEDHNDLTFKNYGVNYKYKDNTFYYKNRRIDSSIWEIKNVSNADEKIKEDVYGYVYDFGEDKLNLEYISAKDRRVEDGQKVINNKNQSYSVSYLDGGDVEQKYTASYENYENEGAWNPYLSNYDSDVIYLGYSYKDKRFTDQELVSYAASEYKKTPDQLTQYEIDRIRQVLQDRENTRSTTFNLNRIIDDKTTYFGDYKRGFHASIMMQKNKKRYEKTGNYLNSLEELEGRLFYSYNRIGVGYIYNQKASWENSNVEENKLKWKDSEKEHEFSLHAKVGKPSEGWRTKAYVKFYDHISGQKDDGGTFDGFGFEVGKEFGYYEWAIAYERDYSYRTKDYEWSAALQFKLLTFPDNNIFGLGATTDIDHKTTPDTYLFNGIKVDDID